MNYLTNRTIEHGRLAPPPHAAHQLGHTLLWAEIPLFKLHLSQISKCGYVGHHDTNMRPQLIPQVLSEVEVRTPVGQFIFSNPKFWRYSLINPALYGWALKP
ncbi:hypothetical protein AMECASPLE_009453 [Ameca splendens]|uniref:Uncharacterized protein n=1 Tax=Ameca splendens TaxID=208324 RepID=A0ABV0XDA8_9TELE